MFVRENNEVTSTTYTPDDSFLSQKTAYNESCDAIVKIVSDNGHIYIESPAYLTHKDDISVAKDLEKKQ